MTAAPLRREDDLTFIRRFIQERSAIVLDDNKDYLVEARLSPLAEAEGYPSMAAMFADLRAGASSSLVKKVVEAMTTNETSFFRDMAPFDCLKSRVLPELVEKRRDCRRLNVWCGASSSGQEPYSVMIIMRDAYPELDEWNVSLLATDISSAMVERTRAGTYSQLEVNRGLPAKLLVKNFIRKGVRWQVKPELQKVIDARELNLIERWPPMPNMDIVFLRNVLIYFDVPTKRRILGKIKNVLAPDGYLFLGGAETTVGIDDDFERVEFPNASCYRLRSGGR